MKFVGTYSYLAREMASVWANMPFTLKNAIVSFKRQSSFKRNWWAIQNCIWYDSITFDLQKTSKYKVRTVSYFAIQSVPSVTETQTEILCQMSYYFQITESLQIAPCVPTLFYLNKWDLLKALSASPRCLGLWISKDFINWQFCKGIKKKTICFSILQEKGQEYTHSV